jgi:hypothetical protein
MEIKVNLGLVTGKAPLKALADVELFTNDGNITIRRCAVFQKPGMPAWSSLPRIPVERNGKKTFVVLIELPSDWKRRVLGRLLDEYREKK